MFEVSAIYDGQNFQLLQPVRVKTPQKVIITFLEGEAGKPDLEEQFEALFQLWWAETAMFSGGKIITENAHYLKIIGLGKSAIPLILKKLQAHPCLLFSALRKITKQNPVPAEHAGHIQAMTEDWLNWGRQNRYI